MNALSIDVRDEVDEFGAHALVARARVDGELFAGGSLATSLVALRRSTEAEGEHWIINCECGDPGCAGLDSAIKVSHSGERISWRWKQGGAPERVWVFDAVSYRSAVLSAIEDAKAIYEAPTIGDSKLEVIPLGDERLFSDA